MIYGLFGILFMMIYGLFGLLLLLFAMLFDFNNDDLWAIGPSFIAFRYAL